MKKFLSSILLLIFISSIAFITVSALKAEENYVNGPQDIRTETDLNYYVDVVESLNEKLTLQVTKTDVLAATITFSTYISFNELEEYIDTHNINVQQIQLRGITTDGTRVTLATLTSKGMKFTENLMHSQAEDGGFELVGITDIYAYVTSAQIASLSNDPLTYLVDTSGDQSFSQSLSNESTNNQVTSAFPKSLTWELEDLNLL